MIHHTFVTIGFAAALAATSACRSGDGSSRVSADATPPGHAVATEVPRGPHGGRLLSDSDFDLEITIFEVGVPPEFRVYPFEKGAPLDPAKVGLTIALHRFGGRVDTIRFARRDDYLVGDRVVEEPHSFDVEVEATSEGRSRRWEYASYEGRTEISPEAIQTSGVVIETAGSATVRATLHLHGRISPNEDRLAHIAPRYPGIVREARKRLGERVARGEVLAVVESNESLRPYELATPIAGTVIEKDVTPGEFVDGARTIYAVADLSTVWVDLAIYQQDLPRLEIGQTVIVSGRDESPTVEGKIMYVSPLGSERTQTLHARAELPNPDMSLRPGLFVSGEVTVEEARVPVAVRMSALQTFRDWDVVFLTDGHIFQAMPVEIGRRDHEWAEIRSGVQADQRYTAQGSFIVKADIGKSGATHEH